jgi:DNA-binding response OmpR family regulator
MATHSDHHDKKILIVEDDEDFGFILQKKFTMEGFTVVLAKDGEEGIAMTEKEKPDLIFSDVLMPKMDGVEMAKKILKTGSHPQIVLLTNLSDVDFTADMQNSKEVDYLIKSNTRIDEIVKKAKEKLGIA